VRSISGVAGLVKSSPFSFEDPHHTSVEGRGVTRSEGHDTETVLVVVGGKESELLLIAFADSNLMITGFVIEGNKEETAGGVAEVVDGIVAARNRIFERQGNLIQTTIGNTHTPDEVKDIRNVFLMRLGG